MEIDRSLLCRSFKIALVGWVCILLILALLATISLFPTILIEQYPYERIGVLRKIILFIEAYAAMLWVVVRYFFVEIFGRVKESLDKVGFLLWPLPVHIAFIPYLFVPAVTGGAYGGFLLKKKTKQA